jgi:hypothetical protein
MLFALGAASSAIDLLSSLQQASSKPATGFTASTTTTASSFDILSTNTTSAQPSPSTDRGQYSALSPETLSALLAAQGQSGVQGASSASASDSLKDLFSQLDADGDGQISKSEFENALGAGGTNIQQADDVFAKLDKSKDGSVDLSELSSALKSKGGHHRHAGGAGGAGGSTDQLLQSLDGASSTSVTNSDGSTTTSITYADGSKVTTTTPPASTSSTGSASDPASSSHYLVEQLIRRQAQAVSLGSTTHAVSVSA